MSDGKRLDGVEAALAHAEQAISDLSDMVAVQGREIEALRRENRFLRTRLERLEGQSGGYDDDNAFVP